MKDITHNKLGGGTSKCVHELVPIRLHFLAVPSPRSEELDEHCLSGSFSVPIVGGELDGARGTGEAEDQ